MMSFDRASAVPWGDWPVDQKKCFALSGALSAPALEAPSMTLTAAATATTSATRTVVESRRVDLICPPGLVSGAGGPDGWKGLTTDAVCLFHHWGWCQTSRAARRRAKGLSKKSSSAPAGGRPLGSKP